MSARASGDGGTNRARRMGWTPGWRGPVLLALSAALLPVGLWAISVGSAAVTSQDIIAAMVHFDGTRDHVVILQVRLPRMLCGLLVGAALAVAGAIMQAVTANPLASPALLGVNAGAAFAVVVAMVLLGSGSSTLVHLVRLRPGPGRRRCWSMPWDRPVPAAPHL